LAAAAGVFVIGAFCANLLLSRTTVSQLDASALRSITNEATFKTIQGNGARAIHVFLSSECPYCRKLKPELDKLQDVTVYRHMLPGATETSRALAAKVWCSEDPVKKWKTVAAGLPATERTCDGAALEKNLALGRA
jgi:thiol:disulfide interchange protein DsbC